VHGTRDQRLIDVLPESFWVVGALGGVGGAAGLGFVIDFRAAAKEREEFPQRDDIKLIESAGEGERWYEKVEDSMHLHVETLAPSAFLEGAQKFLRTVGLDGLTQISVDEQSLPEAAPGRMDLKAAIEACSEYLSKNGESVRTIEITSHGKNEMFTLLVEFFYRRKHRPMNPPIELEVHAMANELGPKEGESFAAYRARMNALGTDMKRTQEVYNQIEAQKKVTYSDFAQHLAEAFPGVRLQFYERLAPGED